MQPLRNFHRNVGKPDGRHIYCKPCKSELHKQRRKVYAKQNKKRKHTPSGTKRCPRCEQELPYSEFRKDSTRKDGHYSHCKSCARK